jgi:hypothetical protein
MDMECDVEKMLQETTLSPLAKMLLKQIVLPFYALQPAIPHPLLLQNPVCTTFVMLYELITTRVLPAKFDQPA